MRKGKKTYLPDIRLLLVAAGVIIITVVIIVFIYQDRKQEQNKEKVAQGISYLESLENQNMAEINEAIKAIRVKHSLEMADTDENMIWGAFENCAVMGDSRAVGFSYYEFLPEDWVIAESGSIISDVSQHIDELKRLNPDRVFLCFGINDIKGGLWPEPVDYAAECATQMQAVMNAVPGCEVYLNSILPPESNAWDDSYARLGEYNSAMQAMTQQYGYHYIDNTYLAEEHPDLYQEDGLHLQPDFYKYWVANMLIEVNEQ